MERDLDETDRVWNGPTLSTEEARYVLQPTNFRTMGEAQEVTNALEENLATGDLGATNVRPELVEICSELVNNAAKHGRTEDGAQVHVRFLPHRRVSAFDVVIADSGAGIRAALGDNPTVSRPETDAEAISLALQELVSGTGDPTRGLLKLWMTVIEMCRPGRKLLLHSGAGLLTMYGDVELEFPDIESR